jgi:hypothetical protein
MIKERSRRRALAHRKRLGDKHQRSNASARSTATTGAPGRSTPQCRKQRADAGPQVQDATGRAERQALVRLQRLQSNRR